jgi:hypothetical protein
MTLVATNSNLVFPSTVLGSTLISWGGTSGGIQFAVTPGVDATTEKIALMGEVMWAGAPTTAKTMGATSKIWFKTSSITFADASTNLRIGIQDIATTTVTSIQPDGTFDVYADVAGNSGLITSSDDNVTKSITLSTSGSKDISHGDLIAVVFDMTARGGSDTFTLLGWSTGGYRIMPTSRGYNSSTWQGIASAIPIPMIMLEANDGTLGIFRYAPFIPVNNGTSGGSSTYDFDSATTYDEYGLIFQVPFRCKVNGVIIAMGTEVSAAADCTLRLYSTPLGTPTEMVAKTLLGEQSIGYSDDRPRVYTFAETELAPNTDYCIALEATSTGDINLGYMTLNSEAHRAVNGLANCRLGRRANQTGAFGEVTDSYPLMAVLISAIDDGTGMGAAQMLLGV